MRRYSTELDPDKISKGYGYELHCSPKDSRNLVYALKGKKVEEAKKFLENIIAMRLPLPAVFHKKKRAHQVIIGPGSFPRKTAGYILKIIKNAENNAEYKGLDTENIRIAHISAYRGRAIKGFMPRAFGRATDNNRSTTNIEIILEEVE